MSSEIATRLVLSSEGLVNGFFFPRSPKFIGHQVKVQDENHRSSTNKSYDSPKTGGKSINLHEIKSKVNQKINQDISYNIPQRKKKHSYLVIPL